MAIRRHGVRVCLTALAIVLVSSGCGGGTTGGASSQATDRLPSSSTTEPPVGSALPVGLDVGTRRGLRYQTYSLSTATYGGTYTYGYVISMGRRGAMVIEARRYPFRHTTRSAYLHYQHIADQMVATGRAFNGGANGG